MVFTNATSRDVESENPTTKAFLISSCTAADAATACPKGTFISFPTQLLVFRASFPLTFTGYVQGGSGGLAAGLG